MEEHTAPALLHVVVQETPTGLRRYALAGAREGVTVRAVLLDGDRVGGELMGFVEGTGDGRRLRATVGRRLGVDVEAEEGRRLGTTVGAVEIKRLGVGVEAIGTREGGRLGLLVG